jgi:hypothetical protein
LRQRAFAWLVAYAFVLQSVLAPIAVLAAAAPTSADGTSFIEICSGRAPLAAGTDRLNPMQHDAGCKHCMGCIPVALLPPDVVPERLGTVAPVTPVRWFTLTAPDPDGPLLSGRGARGPPQAA